MSILEPPEDKPEKWDAADAIEAGENVNQRIQNALASEPVANIKQKPGELRLDDWLACRRFVGEPKPREWLVEGVFPIAQVSLLAATGGVGKSFLLAQLAREFFVRVRGMALAQPVPPEQV